MGTCILFFENMNWDKSINGDKIEINKKTIRMTY